MSHSYSLTLTLCALTMKQKADSDCTRKLHSQTYPQPGILYPIPAMLRETVPNLKTNTNMQHNMTPVLLSDCKCRGL